MTATLLLSLAVGTYTPSAFAADAKPAPKAEKPAKAAVQPGKAAPRPAEKAPKGDGFASDDDRAVYSLGFIMGRNLSSFNLTPAEIKQVQAGMADAALGKPAKADVRMYQPKINEMLQKRMTAAAETEKKKGAAFAKEWVAKEHAQEIPGGGWYKETQAGAGAQPKETDTVKVHYRGTLTDGKTEFDSSYARNEPATFPLNAVIPCWTKGVSMMKVGGKARLVCPSDVAYGDNGHPPTIKGGATLVFDVELLDIVKDQKTDEKK